ncbi:InlB B-repeat-containing protein [Enterococcus sp. ALS3]|uniref:InlB B-repeat-containing protein n=1 Tax=Enterococcus alishanensis TaxID=1303817 RepID=A0ABS6THP7_9ENTE|nr:BspA family leucine-rich repeat surface protein [Enterococcus alishanensis]MBV7392412.1 InlB B-repeat-containing protein [Enterococcus alishanensis]
MKKYFCTLAFFLAFLSVGLFTSFSSKSVKAVSAYSEELIYSGSLGTVDWNLSSDGTLYLGPGTLPTLTKSPWKDYAPLIKKITIKGEITSGSYLNNLFDGLSNLSEIENLNYIDTSKTTRMMYVFRNCYSLKSVDLSKWDTSNVVTFTSMFNGCRSLTSLDLSSFNTKSATSYVSMFSGCSSLTYLNIRNFSAYGTTTAVSKYNMFDSSNKVLNTIVLGEISPFVKESGLPEHTATDNYDASWTGLNELKTYSSTRELLSSYDGTIPDTYVWTPKYSVIFHSNNGSGVYSQQYLTYGVETNLSANTFTNNGATFIGWNTQPDGSGESYEDKQEVSSLSTDFGGTVTLYAQWTANNYIVKYDANTGTGTMDDQTFTYDVGQNLITNTFTKTGYTFTGWNTAADGSVTTYTDGQSVTNLTTASGGTVTLYAQWKANTERATVTYIDDTTNTTLSTKVLTGDYGTTDSFRTATTIDRYVASGYELVSDNYPTNGVTYTEETQAFEVHLKHVSEGTTERKIITETIHYVYSDGSEASKDYKTNITFIRTKTTDTVTGDITYGEWTSVEWNTTFTAVISPDIIGYTSDKAQIDEITGVTEETADIEETVTYSINKEEATVTYIDDKTGKKIETNTVSELTSNPMLLTGDYQSVSSYRTTETIQALVAKGYILVSDSYPSEGVAFSENDQSYEVHLKHCITSKEEIKKVTEVIHYVYSNGNKAADDYTNELFFVREVDTDSVTGEVTNKDWTPQSSTFVAVNSPSISGYTADKSVVAAVENITGDSSDVVETVTYTKKLGGNDSDSSKAMKSPTKSTKKFENDGQSYLPQAGEKISNYLLLVGLILLASSLYTIFYKYKKRNSL